MDIFMGLPISEYLPEEISLINRMIIGMVYNEDIENVNILLANLDSKRELYEKKNSPYWMC